MISSSMLEREISSIKPDISYVLDAIRRKYLSARNRAELMEVNNYLAEFSEKLQLLGLSLERSESMRILKNIEEQIDQRMGMNKTMEDFEDSISYL